MPAEKLLTLFDMWHRVVFVHFSYFALLLSVGSELVLWLERLVWNG